MISLYLVNVSNMKFLIKKNHNVILTSLKLCIFLCLVILVDP